jgi:hypothetical protein
MKDDPDFFAWLDGELAEPQASVMAAKVASDPELAAYAQEHRALAARLSEAFDPIASAPVPERLRTAANTPMAEVVDFDAARARRRQQWSMAGLAAAASLALGLVIGGAIPREGGSYRSHGSQLAAAGPLARALDQQPASAGEQQGIRLSLSFRDRQGRFCRSFTADEQSGLACRSDNHWTVEGLVRTGGSRSEYRMASGQDPALAAMIDSRLMGEPLDPESERTAIQQGWDD